MKSFYETSFHQTQFGKTTLTASVASEFQKPRYMCRKKVKEKSVDSRTDKQFISRAGYRSYTDFINYTSKYCSSKFLDCIRKLRYRIYVSLLCLPWCMFRLMLCAFVNKTTASL